MKLQQLLTIALVSICSLMLTACEVDNSENGIDKTQLEGVLTIYEGQTATPNGDGSISFSQKSRTYTIRMKRK